MFFLALPDDLGLLSCIPSGSLTLSDGSVFHIGFKCCLTFLSPPIRFVDDRGSGLGLTFVLLIPGSMPGTEKFLC